MKKFKLIVPSFIALIFCMLLIAGSTFALFTSEASANIAVTSGRVQVSAQLKDLKLYSATTQETTYGQAGTITGGNYAGTYYYDLQDTTFANGGTATLTSSSLILDKITPGDKVTLQLDAKNLSNVNIKYRISFNATSTSDEDLLSVLVVNFTGNSDLGNKEFTGLRNYKSAWIEKAAPANENDDNIANTNIEIIFPLSVESSEENNFKYENKTVGINITLEAVQGNAKTTGVETAEMVAKTVENFEDSTSKVEAAPIMPENPSDPVTFNDKQVVAEVAESEVVVTTVAPATLLQAAYSQAVAADPQAAEENVKVELNVSDLSVSTNNVTSTSTVSVDVELLINDVKVENSSVDIPVEIYLGPGMYIDSFYHDTQELTKVDSQDDLAENKYFYDVVSGKLYFITRSFSPFRLIYSNGKNVQTFAELKEALTHEKITVRMLNDITIPQDETLAIAEGVVLNGNNNILKTADIYDRRGAFMTSGSIINIEGDNVKFEKLTIKSHAFGTLRTPQESLIDVKNHDNLVIDNCIFTYTTEALRAGKLFSRVTKNLTMTNTIVEGYYAMIYQSNGGAEERLVGTLTVSDCVIKTNAYTCNFGESVEGSKILVTNTFISGWTSYGGDLQATFTNCHFSKALDVLFDDGNPTPYNFMRAYSATTLSGCTFDDDFEFETVNNAVSHINNCWKRNTSTDEKVALTADNYDPISISINSSYSGVGDGSGLYINGVLVQSN